MDNRSWPWKKKSSDKATTEKLVVGNESTSVSSLSHLASLENQEKCKNTNYVQITMESYTHMSRMEDQVKDLKEKLMIAQSEIKNKECLILQHAKVAEEAVSGWEKADAETLALKHQLESITLSKLTAENRASHLDDALKECTRQIRIVKDESEQKLKDMILTKTTQWDKIKAELERKIDELSQGLHRASSDNTVLTRSLQDRSEMIVKISEERSKAESEVEKLKTKIHLAEKEVSLLKYDVHVASKEVEIRNEEKNMSLKSAEIANKQSLEGVKKIAKLEVECQRLKGLLKRKLPGPNAMAQMKLEVESFGNEFIDPRGNIAKRSSEMEEEIQTLKELLATSNNELQVSRNVCAKTLGKLKILEVKNDSKSNLSESPSSATSVSEDGFDEEGSSSECGGQVTSTDSHKAKKVSVNDSSSSKLMSFTKLELMDDFLETEKLASNDPMGDTFDKKELEQLKLEKENIALELSKCLENLESTKTELRDKEELISELKSKVNSSKDLQSLTETQLKCVTESYKSLELSSKELKSKVKSLEEETERLKMAFSTEKLSHEETLAKCKDLQEQIQRNCSSSKLKPNQEKDIASATQKLAACQETIHLLSQQLQSLQPQSNHITKSQSLQEQKALEDDQSHSFRHTVNPTVHAIIKSSSVSSSSKEDNEKHTRGLGRFFSSKVKNNGR